MSEPTETVAVENLDQFVMVLTAWHDNKCQVLKHLLEIPEGSEVQVSDDEPRIMTGDLLAGFRLGIEMALSELGTLPFVAEMEDVPAANDAQG